LIWHHAAQSEVPMEVAGRDKAELWRNRIDAQRASGQSVRVWCQANDAREHSFYWWRARLGLSPARRRSRRRSKPIAFAQVVVDAAATKLTPVAEALRLRLAGERELILPGSMPLEQVARLIHAIEGKPLRVEAPA
jgi:hypothetical protein